MGWKNTKKTNDSENVNVFFLIEIDNIIISIKVTSTMGSGVSFVRTMICGIMKILVFNVKVRPPQNRLQPGFTIICPFLHKYHTILKTKDVIMA